MIMGSLSESAGKFFITKGGVYAKENEFLSELDEAKTKVEIEEAQKKLIELDKLKQEEINQKLQTLELIPMFDKVILLPYPQNPYRKIIEGNIIVDYDGTFKNPDSGEWDKEKVFIGCAKVIEVGPITKYLKVGDDVFYDTRTVYPVPMLNLGYKLTSEVQILCVINEGLKKRFNIEGVGTIKNYGKNND